MNTVERVALGVVVFLGLLIGPILHNYALAAGMEWGALFVILVQANLRPVSETGKEPPKDE